jgi:hypothetical protein
LAVFAPLRETCISHAELAKNAKKKPICWLSNKPFLFLYYTYKFDSKGNWIERVKMIANNKGLSGEDMVTFRLITYYRQNN